VIQEWWRVTRSLITMAVKAAVQSRSEETPLLRDGSREGIADGRSEETLAGNGDEEELLNPDRANQHVGKGRGFLIILSVWALIFLQGKSKSWLGKCDKSYLSSWAN